MQDSGGRGSSSSGSLHHPHPSRQPQPRAASPKLDFPGVYMQHQLPAEDADTSSAADSMSSRGRHQPTTPRPHQLMTSPSVAAAAVAAAGATLSPSSSGGGRQQLSSQPLLAAPAAGSSSTSLGSSLDREPSREEASLGSASPAEGERERSLAVGAAAAAAAALVKRPLPSRRSLRPAAARGEDDDEEEEVMTRVSLPPLPLSRSPLPHAPPSSGGGAPGAPPPPPPPITKRATCGIRRSSRVVVAEEDETGGNTDTTGSVSSSVTRGLSSGGNDADDEDDDDSVFAHVVIGVTSNIRRQSNSFELGNTGRQRQRHLRFLRNVHSAQARLTQEHSFGSSREGDFEQQQPKKKATKYLTVNQKGTVERLKEEPDFEEEEEFDEERSDSIKEEDDSIGGLGERIRRLASKTIEFGDSIDELRSRSSAAVASVVSSSVGSSGTGSGHTTDHSSSAGEVGSTNRRKLNLLAAPAASLTQQAPTSPGPPSSRLLSPTPSFQVSQPVPEVSTNELDPLPAGSLRQRRPSMAAFRGNSGDAGSDSGSEAGSLGGRGQQQRSSTSSVLSCAASGAAASSSCDRESIRSATANAPFFSLSVESDTSHLSHESASTVIVNPSGTGGGNNSSAMSSACDQLAEQQPVPDEPDPPISRERLMSLSADVTAVKDPSVSTLSSAISSLANTLLNLRSRSTGSGSNVAGNGVAAEGGGGSRKLRSIVETCSSSVSPGRYSSSGSSTGTVQSTTTITETAALASGGGGRSRQNQQNVSAPIPCPAPAPYSSSALPPESASTTSLRQPSPSPHPHTHQRAGHMSRMAGTPRNSLVRQDTPRIPPGAEIDLPMSVSAPAGQTAAVPPQVAPPPKQQPARHGARRGAMMTARRIASRFAMSDSSSSQSLGSMDKTAPPPSIVCSQHELENRYDIRYWDIWNHRTRSPSEGISISVSQETHVRLLERARRAARSVLQDPIERND